MSTDVRKTIGKATSGIICELFHQHMSVDSEEYLKETIILMIMIISFIAGKVGSNGDQDFSYSIEKSTINALILFKARMTFSSVGRCKMDCWNYFGISD